ncbi:MAG: hypothetical protein GVY25_04110 [Bacteroidetes bacterium]|nr:hypothetical protein [Bacteroidota bacterium]
MSKLTLALLFVLLSCTDTRAQQDSLSEADRVRIAEVYRLAEAVQDSMWNGWSEAPFALLLVTPEHEYLVHHPKPSEDFRSVRYDSLIQSVIYVRERVYSTSLLASFPAVGGVPTIVIGQPENTGKSSTFWVLTALHEHFHQFQSSRPGHFEAVDALDLSAADETSMWMLNYPFPYDSTIVVERFVDWKATLLAALRDANTPDFDDRLSAALESRARLQKVLEEDDYKYLSFQLWQEGVARYTEYKVAKAATRYRATEAFKSLGDFVPFEQASDSIYRDIMQGLTDSSLDKHERVAFYPAGAAEAMLLDVANPEWKQQYFEERFDLTRLYGEAP